MEIIKREQQIVIDECGDLRLISGPERTFILSKEDMPKRKGDLWEYKKWEKMLRFYSDKYLATYHEGNWSEFGDDYELDMAQKWLEKDFRNLYRGSPGNDGFLYNVDGSPLLRKIKCEFWGSYYTNLDKLKEELEKNEKWSNFEWGRSHWSNRDICGSMTLNAAYLPTQDELNKWFARKDVSYGAQGLGSSFGVLHDFKYIKKYKKTAAP
jgi:hypothetical protein